MNIYKLKDPRKAAFLFAGWEETIIASCLQGVMGEIYAAGDKTASIRSAKAVLGDFCFLAGEPDRQLLSHVPEGRAGDFMILIPRQIIGDIAQESGARWYSRDEAIEFPSEKNPRGRSEELRPGQDFRNRGQENAVCPNLSEGITWESVIYQVYGTRARQVTRYAIKKEPGVWNLDRLRQAVAELPPEYTLCLIEEELYQKCLENPWSQDLVAQYGNYERYREAGLGVAILKGEELVAGASSYSSYRGGIEVEIDTREDCRRRGLAYVCGARLILECCARNLYPSWDAHNLWSVALAKKLGYHLDYPYRAYEIRRDLFGLEDM